MALTACLRGGRSRWVTVTKYRRQGGAWEIEPSLVRMLSSHAGYSFTNDTPIRPLIYLSGPAGIKPHTPTWSAAMRSAPGSPTWR